MSTILQPLDEVLGARSKVRLLRELLRQERAVSGREAGRLAGLSPAGARNALQDLVALGVVEREGQGVEHLFRINRGHFLVRHGLEPLFSAEERAVDAVFDRLADLASDLVEETGVDILSAVVFGSVAREEDVPGSDLDLLLVVSSEEEELVRQAIAERAPDLERTFGLALSPVVMTLDRLRELREEGASLAVAIEEEGRRVYGAYVDELIGGQAVPE